MQIKPSVEVVCEGCKVAGGIFGISERVVSDRKGGLDVAQDGVDLFEFGQLACLALSHDNAVMGACLATLDIFRPVGLDSFRHQEVGRNRLPTALGHLGHAFGKRSPPPCRRVADAAPGKAS